MKGIIRETAIVLGIALFASVLSAFFHPRRPAWFLVESEDVKRWSISEELALELIEKNDTLWIDARPNKKFREGHFPGAISLDLENWGDLMFQHQETLQSAIGKPVIVYCDGTRCEKSKEVAQRLRELLGLEPVYLLKGNWRKIAERSQKSERTK